MISTEEELVCTDYEVESLWVISTEGCVKEKMIYITKLVVEKERNEMVAPVKVLEFLLWISGIEMECSFDLSTLRDTNRAADIRSETKTTGW